jgi:hypothetical protein
MASWMVSFTIPRATDDPMEARRLNKGEESRYPRFNMRVADDYTIAIDIRCDDMTKQGALDNALVFVHQEVSDTMKWIPNE